MIFAIRNKEKAAKVLGLGSEKSPMEVPGTLGVEEGIIRDGGKTHGSKNPWFYPCFFFGVGGGGDNKNSTDLRFFPLIF